MLNERWRYSSADVKVRRDTPQRFGFEGGGSPIDRQLVDLVSAPETHLPTIIPPDSDHSTSIKKHTVALTLWITVGQRFRSFHIILTEELLYFFVFLKTRLELTVYFTDELSTLQGNFARPSLLWEFRFFGCQRRRPSHSARSEFRSFSLFWLRFFFVPPPFVLTAEPPHW